MHEARSSDLAQFVIEGDSGGPVIGPATAYGLIKGRGGTVTNPTSSYMYFIDIADIRAPGGLGNNLAVKIDP